jgi:hypothetical protein
MYLQQWLCGLVMDRSEPRAKQAGMNEQYGIASPLPAGRGSEYSLMRQRPQHWPHKNSVKTAEFYPSVV